VQISARARGRKRVEARVELTYGGPFTLQNPIVVYPSGFGALVHELEHPLRPGATYERRVSSVDPAGSYECPDKSLGGLLVTRLVRRPYRLAVDHGRGAYLIGWADAPFPVRAEPNVRTRASTTLVVVELPVRYRDGVPYGAAISTWESSTVAHVSSSMITREVSVQFDLPGARRHHVTSLDVMLTAQRGTILSAGNLHLEGDYRGDDDVVRRRAISLDEESIKRSESGRQLQLQLPNPERWVSLDGEVVLYQRFDRPRMEEDRNYSARVDVSVGWEGGAKSDPPPGAGKGEPGGG
jgi:hypothetical protein